MLNLSKQRAASNGTGAVLVGEFGGKPVLVRYAPKSLGDPKNRGEFEALCERAIAKLGWRRDRRCKGGYRRAAHLPHLP